MKISAVIIAKNEEAKIGRAIRSVLWADDILVVDSGSTDRTVEVAKQLGARTVFNEWNGFSEQKQFALDNALYDHVLSLDADESVSEELKNEIRKLVESDRLSDGYLIPRLAYYHGRPIKYSGWYPDRQLRFFDRRKGKWNNRKIHESFQLESGATLSKLNSDILHFSVEDAQQHHRMIGERYAPLAAEQMFDLGKRTSALRVAVAGPAAFIRSFILKAGFLDGFAGYCIAKFAAHHAYLKHLILWELQKSAQK